MEDKKIGFIGGKFLPLHLGHMYAIFIASNQVEKLYVILSSSPNRDKELCKRDGIKYIPPETRLSWLGESLSNFENIEVLHIGDNHGNEDYDWEEGANMIKKAIGDKIDYIFSSEDSYDEHFKKYYPDSKHVIIDNLRNTFNLSATEIRKDLYKHWDKLPESVKAYFVKKIAIVGTESCGKTTLCKKLAKFYNTNYAPEVGRKFCEKYSNKLTPNMFDLIAMEHYLLQNKKIRNSNKILFVDSESVITQYYLDMYFQREKSSLIEEIIKLQNYDLVLYLEPDVKWVNDGLRFAGEEEIRKKNNERLKKMYQERGIKFVEINGNYNERFNKAKKLVDDLFKEEKNG